MTAMTAAAPVRAPVATEPSESRIDKDSHFNGLYETKQNLRIEGLAEGEIQCEGTVTVAEGARVKAKVTANSVTIAGELDGEVLCHGVFQIMPSGQVSASVSARRLIVQEGGLYNGDFRMITEAKDEKPAARATTSREPAPMDAGADVLDGLSSDEWWRKFSAGEATGGETSGSEPPSGERPGSGPADGKPSTTKDNKHNR